MLNGQQVNVTDYQSEFANFQLEANSSAKSSNVLDILVENMSRANKGNNSFLGLQRKGILADVLINDQIWNQFQIYLMSFGEQFWNTSVLTIGKPTRSNQISTTAPRLFEFILNITDDVASDTFLDMSSWNKGNVFVNGFNIGRFYRIGPQQTLYLPGPLLKKGNNVIHVLELHSSTNNQTLVFTNQPVLDLNK